jgi:surfeit locus 1 family protein
VSGTARPGSIVGSAIATLVVFAILCGLGVWQIERKAWKENLIATLDTRLAAAPQLVPPASQWPNLQQGRDEYRRVALNVEFERGKDALVYAAASAFRPDVRQPGFWVLSPARLPAGGTVIIDRGYIPTSQRDAIPPPPTGPVDLVGIMRWPEASGMFTPVPDLAHGVWYARDITAIAAAKNWGPVAPFSIEQESPQRPDAPKVGKLVVNLPNNHLQYIITWFGLAAGLLGVYGVWLVRRLRGR